MAATTLLFIVILLAAAGVDGMIRLTTQSIDDGWQLVKMSSGLAYTGGNNRWASFTVTVPNGRSKYTITLCSYPASVGFSNVSTDKEVLYTPLVDLGNSKLVYIARKRPLVLTVQLSQAGANMCIPAVVPQLTGQIITSLIWIEPSQAVIGSLIGVWSALWLMSALWVYLGRGDAADQRRRQFPSSKSSSSAAS